MEKYFKNVDANQYLYEKINLPSELTQSCKISGYLSENLKFGCCPIAAKYLQPHTETVEKIKKNPHQALADFRAFFEYKSVTTVLDSHKEGAKVTGYQSKILIDVGGSCRIAAKGLTAHMLWPEVQLKDAVRRSNRNKLVVKNNYKNQSYFTATLQQYADLEVAESHSNLERFCIFTDTLYYITPTSLLESLCKMDLLGHAGAGSMHVFKNSGDIILTGDDGIIKNYGYVDIIDDSNLTMQVQGNNIPYTHAHDYDQLYDNDIMEIIKKNKNGDIKVSIIKNHEIDCGATKYIQFDIVVSIIEPEKHEDCDYSDDMEDVHNPISMHGSSLGSVVIHPFMNKNLVGLNRKNNNNDKLSSKKSSNKTDKSGFNLFPKDDEEIIIDTKMINGKKETPNSKKENAAKENSISKEESNKDEIIIRKSSSKPKDANTEKLNSLVKKLRIDGASVIEDGVIVQGPNGKSIVIKKLCGTIKAKVFQQIDTTIFNWGTHNRVKTQQIDYDLEINASLLDKIRNIIMSNKKIDLIVLQDLVQNVHFKSNYSDKSYAIPVIEYALQEALETKLNLTGL
jgi:hypothetical protein